MRSVGRAPAVRCRSEAPRSSRWISRSVRIGLVVRLVAPRRAPSGVGVARSRRRGRGRPARRGTAAAAAGVAGGAGTGAAAGAADGGGGRRRRSGRRARRARGTTEPRRVRGDRHRHRGGSSRCEPGGATMGAPAASPGDHDGSSGAAAATAAPAHRVREPGAASPGTAERAAAGQRRRWRLPARRSRRTRWSPRTAPFAPRERCRLLPVTTCHIGLSSCRLEDRGA